MVQGLGRRSPPPRPPPSHGAREGRGQKHLERQRGNRSRPPGSPRRRRGRAGPRGATRGGGTNKVRAAASPRRRRGRRPPHRGPGGRLRPTAPRDAQGPQSPRGTHPPQGERPAPVHPTRRPSTPRGRGGSVWPPAQRERKQAGKGREGRCRPAKRQHRGRARRRRDRRRPAARSAREGGVFPGGGRQRRPAAQRGGRRGGQGSVAHCPRPPSDPPKPGTPAKAATEDGGRGQDRGDRERGPTQKPKGQRSGKSASQRRRGAQPRHRGG